MNHNPTLLIFIVIEYYVLGKSYQLCIKVILHQFGG
jgi:hypothetical protein